MKQALRFLAFTILIVVGAIAANAQTGTGSVRGTVRDSLGGLIPGAKVTLTNKDRNYSQARVTSADGQFSFVSLTPGAYGLTVEASNFKKLSTTIDVLVDTILEPAYELQAGNVSEVVNVSSGDEAVLNTSNGSVGNVLTNRQVQDLPLLSRNTADLLSLQPGVTTDGSVNGGRSDQANVTLDGVDVNEQQGGRAFFSVLRVSQEALQEFRVTTSNADADKGRSSGAQISLVSRRGGNEWRGSGYFYLRPDTKFQANDFFNNSDGIGQLGDSRRNFGGSISGPIKRDKLFFFANYERFNENADVSVNRIVPLPSLGQGIVKYFSEDGSSDAGCPAGTPTGVICLTTAEINTAYINFNGITPGVNPIALSTLASAATRYRSNNFGVGDGLNTGGFRFNAPTSERNNTVITTLNYVYNESHNFEARYQTQSDKGTLVQRFPDTPSAPTWSHPWGIAASHNWTISNNKVNKFTYGFTRAAFTNGSDTDLNFTSFRFVYQPFNFNRSLARVTPVHNIRDDFTWIIGNHSLSMGLDLRFISNKRKSFGSSFDVAVMNPSFYASSGRVVTNPFDNFADQPSLRDALTAVIGRYSQYSINAQYGKDGRVFPLGSPSVRDFRTQEYEFYAQDSFKLFPSLTVNYGVRFSTSTPVYEANGLQVKPVQSLGEFFDKRKAGALAGVPFNGLISVDLAGKANKKEGYYKQDWNNFAPAFSVAWSPNFKNEILRGIFGGGGKSSLRGGYRMTFDRLGSALAVAFDLNSTLGFSAASQTAANRFNVSTRLGPLFTGFNQQVRDNPLFNAISYSNSISFPLQTLPNEAERIEQSLDDRLVTPYHHNFSLSYGRDIGKGISIEAAYVGRLARNLLVSVDTAHFNNIKDPVSGQDFYGVMSRLIDLRNAGVPFDSASVPNLAWTNRFLPGLPGFLDLPTLTPTQALYALIARDGFDINDYTFVQTIIDDVDTANLFVHPQYATFAAYSTLGTSDYHGLQLSFRKRLSSGLAFDANYTFSHSLDTASGNESSGTISSGASLILNPLDLNENRGNSDFDVRHLVNANFVYDLPIGRGRMFLGNSNRFVNAVLGGWQLSGIFRWNTGVPIGQPFDSSFWATNWNVQSNGVRLTDSHQSSARNGRGGRPNIFSDVLAAYKNYRNAKPGEAGDRNLLRDQSFVSIDTGLAKSVSLKENHKFTFRLDVFNVTNTQRLTGISAFGLEPDPFRVNSLDAVPLDWGRYTNIQGKPRIVQFAFRYDF